MARSKIIDRLFFRLLPVQILLVAVSSINSIIDGAVAGKFIGPAALSVIGLYFPMMKLMDTVNAVLLGSRWAKVIWTRPAGSFPLTCSSQ